MTATKKDQKTFSERKEELNTALAWFEGDNIDIDEAIVRYKHAIKLVTELEEYLEKAENEIKKLSQ
ncbi:MAG: exodeoxyribonuclease VII small subunit [Candidatus Saccharibacteria bacterium]|nr:exodeoxyribonuclease VII small subunit [Candidatus Saccharibacteria bacterium]